MKTAKMNNFVKVQFTGKTDDGKIFDAATSEYPLCFQLGAEGILPGFSSAIAGMKENETKEFVLDAENGFGQRKEELVQALKRQSFDQDLHIKTGMVLGVTVEKDGKHHKVPALVLSADDEHVVVDYNHPLSGKTLHYSVTLIEVEEGKG